MNQKELAIKIYLAYKNNGIAAPIDACWTEAGKVVEYLDKQGKEAEAEKIETR